MYSRFHYILIGLIGIIVYLFYLIAYYKFNQFQTDHFIETIINNNAEITERNIQKEAIEQYIHTPAYQTQVAKATQNKKLPGEEIINVVRQEDLDGNKELDINTALAPTQRRTEDVTLNMTNPERWIYLFQNGIPRS